MTGAMSVRHQGDIFIDADGAPGADAWNGRDGADGARERDGERGEDAGVAEPGQPGGRTQIVIRSGASDPRLPFDGVSVTGHTRKAGESGRQINVYTSARDLGSVTLSARGGKGGDGGHGGDGGRGGDGRRGSDATRYSSGTSGTAAGDGGDGGHGSDGAAGGAGGLTEIQLDERDAYLLMAVTDAESPGRLIQGGPGGHRGRHGQGGRGGDGGRGGSSYRWSETESRTESYTDANGNRQTRQVSHTVWHSNPGGSDGPDGSRGWTPTSPLHDGPDGAPGELAIFVADSGGHAHRYHRRYDLEIVDFAILEDGTRDADGIFEFGEVVHAARVRVRNVGGMPTPPAQRVRLVVLSGAWARPLGDEIFLAESIPPHGEAVVPGSVRFQIPLARIEKAGEPFVVKQDIGLDAFQLGPEPGEARGARAPFQRRYSRTGLRRSVTAQFPVENRSGVVALRSLGEGERTVLSFDVANVSQMPIGERSARPRKLAVQIELLDSGVGPGEVSFADERGVEIDLGGEIQGFRGYFVRIGEIPARSFVHVRGQIGFRGRPRPYSGIHVRATLWLEDLFDPQKWRVAQRREVTIRLEPAYVYRKDARLLLVTNNNTTEEGFLAWRSLLEGSLGLPASYWSISRYGHIDLRRDLGDGTDLATHLEDRAVILLNQEFQPRSTDETDLPTEYLRGRDFRDGATRRNTHFAVIGSPNFKLKQLLEPTSDARRGGLDFNDQDSFLEKEEKSPGTFTEEVFKDDILTCFDVVPQSGYTWPFARPSVDEHLLKKARALQSKLVAMHPDRRYVLVTRPLETPVKEGHFLFFPRWSLGHVEVRRTLDIETGSATVLAVSGALLNDPRLVFGFEARFAVLLALTFEDKLDRLTWLLAAEPDALDEDRSLTARALVHAILVDLAEEQAALRRSDVSLTEATLGERLSNLKRLLDYPLHTEIDAGANKWDALVELCAGIRAIAEAHLAWWKPFGRDRKVSRHVREQLALLVHKLFDAHAVDPAGQVAIDSRTAGERIEERTRSLLERMREQRKEARANGVRRSLGETAHAFFERPEGMQFELTRDVDVWLDPKSRVLDAEKFQAAQRAEARREAKQEQLRALNAEVRASMLVPTSEPTEAEVEEIQAEYEAQAATEAQLRAT